MPEPLTIDDPERAHVLLRCTQEIITNAVRHAGASRLWLSARADGARASRLQARDDGRGADQVAARQRPARHARAPGRMWRPSSISSPRPARASLDCPTVPPIAPA